MPQPLLTSFSLSHHLQVMTFVRERRNFDLPGESATESNLWLGQRKQNLIRDEERDNQQSGWCRRGAMSESVRIDCDLMNVRIGEKAMMTKDNDDDGGGMMRGRRGGMLIKTYTAVIAVRSRRRECQLSTVKTPSGISSSWLKDSIR